MHAQTVGTLFSGAALVGHRGEVVFSGGYGFADIEREIPNRTQTQFRIGSITKPFTAIAVLQLQEDGLLSVEDPICGYLTACPSHWAGISIHHLLSHTSGLFDFTNTRDYLDMTARPAARDEIIGRFRDRPLGFEPGARFEYSNSNYHLLGTIIENVTGQPYGRVLADRILAPARLADTGFGSTDPGSGRFAVGYRSGEDGTANMDSPVDESWSFAAGGLYSTVEDLHRWSEALKADALLSAASSAAMFTPVTETYGYGWSMPTPSEETLGRAVRRHGGRIQGFTACFTRFHADDLTAIVLSNNVMADVCPMTRDLAAIWLGEDHRMPIARRAINLDTAILDRYVGEYRYSKTTTIQIAREGDKLIAQVSQSPERFQLFPESETEFFLKTFDLRVVFATNRRGETSSLVLYARDRRIVAPRLSE